MNFRVCLLAMCGLAFSVLAEANDFGVLRTALPIEKSVWRLEGGGVASLEDNGREALILSAGTGFNPQVDVQGKLAISGDDTAIGGAVNYLVTSQGKNSVDVSVNAGYHYVIHDQSDVSTADLGVIFSKSVSPKFSVYGALTLGFNNRDVPEGEDGSTTSTHLVPGLEYTINKNLNFLAEIGIGLSDADTYIAGSLHYYWRR